MPNEPRIQSRDIPFTCAEPVYRDAQEASPRAITISTMTTTTIVSAQVTTAITGYYVIPSDGNARGQVRQIKSVTGTTATVDSAWNSTASVTTIRLWQPPDIPVVGTSAGSTTTVVSSAHASLTNEPDDYWNSKGYGLIGRNSTFAGGFYQESDFTSSTGTFQCSGGFQSSATPGIGAFFDLRHLVRSEGPVNASVNQKTLTRRIVGFKDADAAVPITAEGTVEFSMAVKPLTASAGDGIAATPPLDIRDYLQDHFTETLETGDIISNASGSTIVFNDITPNFGSFFLLADGSAVQVISAVNTGTNQIAGTIAASSVAYASAWYTPKTSDFRTRTFDIYKGGVRRELYHGCMPTLEINVARDQVVTFAWKYAAAIALEYETTRPVSFGLFNGGTAGYPLTLIDTSIPTDGKSARFLIDGVKVLVGELKINPGLTPIARPSLSGLNQSDGMAMDMAPTTGSFNALADVDDISSFKALGDRLRNGDVVQLHYQKGASRAGTFCIGMPAAQLTSVKFNYANGLGELACDFVCQVPSLSSTGGAGLPGFAFGWM